MSFAYARALIGREVMPASRMNLLAMGRSTMRRVAVVAVALLAVVVLQWLTATAPALAACANPVACENALPGDPPSDWEVSGVGDSTIQGFATSMSVNVGQTEYFKIKTPSSAYHIDILRLGYYQGNGARKIASGILPSATLPQTQPACLTNSSTGLIDCGNWGISASWTVPANAVSGIYIAHLVRDDPKDPGGDSQIVFVVRNDSSQSDILVSTSDETWEAYNAYGGNSLYTCTVACPPGNPLAYKAAYAVSYNRPFDGAINTDGGASWLYYAEYQMVRFLERNGYDVSYTSSSDVDRSASLLLNHKLFISSGHDEYWSAGQRANVTAARDAGVNLAFFSGNEVFWKTRWSTSIDGSNTAYRTLITYKETHFTAPVDPQDPPTWTGTWRDPRFSPPADGAQPENALTGQLFVVNSGTSDIMVPSAYSKLRLWRGTGVASLAAGKTITLGAGIGTLGYEWDSDADDGFRPPGLFDLSATTATGVQTFTDYGSTVTDNGTATHHLTLYRAPSGALVFGAGTVQWAWGLDNTNAWGNTNTDPSGLAPDPNMEQATVNLFADMHVQPATLQPGLSAAAASTDTTAPGSSIGSPTPGSSVQDGSKVTISGVATDAGGGVVAGVEVSTDGGSTWHPAALTTPAGASVNWSYTWIAHGNPSATIQSRAVDDSGNLEIPSTGVTVEVSCPCTLWGSQTPDTPDSGDAESAELGVKFKSDAFGTVTGIRFYKAATNTGTHVGSLWTASGQLLARATFTGETASGWQTVTFSSPVTIMPGTTYVASYFAPVGHYSATSGYFYPPPSPPPLGGGSIDSPPLHAIANAASANGVYTYATSSSFPVNSFGASNYWVDVMFTPTPTPGQVSGVSATPGYDSATLTWNAPTGGGTVTSYVITPYIGAAAQTPTTVTGSPPATGVTVGGLQQGTSYTFTVQAANPNGPGPASASSNPVVPTGPTAPAAPTAVSAMPATGQALVSWTAPTDNGSPITSYTITPYIGAVAQTSTPVASGTATSATVKGLTNGTQYTFKVSATNGLGTGPQSLASNATTPENMIFDLATPATVDSGDGSSVELGVKFTADTSGQVMGIRFYKSAANTGTHIGSLWDASGNLLASATFTSESAAGWQYVTFASPVAIAAGSTYVAGYFAPNGHYSYTSTGLSSAADNAPLHALANPTSANGVYAYSATSTFPTGSFNASNYWVDVMFQPTPPAQPTNVSATAGYSSATVTWNAPSSGGVTKYTVTPYIGSTPQPASTVTGSPPTTTAAVGNLTPGASYTFTVTASNAQGDGQPSAPSAPVAVLAPTSPAAPTGVTASPASGQALVRWTAPNPHGSPITSYTVTPYLNGVAQTPTPVNNASATTAAVTGLKNGSAYTFTVSATNGVGTGPESVASSSITPVDTIFDFATPGTIDSGDTSSIEVAVKFTADSSGQVTGIRFYKAAANTGTHIGSLWDASGKLLASATFGGESASGWQYVTFATPVSITAGATYVAGYLAPAGHYSYTNGGLSSAVNNAPLHAVANATSANGVYAYSATSTFPSSSFNATNYWVDVTFLPDPPAAPSAPTNVTASPATGQALVSWTAPNAHNSPITSYTVTPYASGIAQTPVRLGSGSATSATLKGLNNGTPYTFTVSATNAVGSSAESAASSAIIPNDTLFDFATPTTIDSGDTTPIEVGVKFTADTSGHLVGLRFYKAAANTGTHIGSLWDASGNLLASATFTGESPSGWQYVTFATPVPVAAGTTYVAGYLAPNGHYSATAGQLTSPFDTPPLHALSTATSANGVYAYSATSTFPTSSFNATNYWVDVLFTTS